MQLIDGNAIANEIVSELSKKVDELGSKKPCITFIRVGEDPASVSYVRKKERIAAKIGIQSRLLVLPESISQNNLIKKIDILNKDNDVHGILVQAPLPSCMDERIVFNRVSALKDVDGFNAVNLGKICQELDDAFASCTPAGILQLIERSKIDLSGKHVVILGRSLIVGKPMGLLCLRKAIPGNATVTFCHSRTENLSDLTKQADVLICAIGKPHFVTAKMVREGAVVIDVGINRIADQSKKSGFRLVGDVDFNEVADKTSMITPVPGGVGPMTVAMLMSNTIKAYETALQSK